MQLINLTFEGMLKPKQKREFTPIEIKLSDKVTPNSDDSKYIERCQNNILKEQEEAIQKIIEERLLIKAKDKQEEAKTIEEELLNDFENLQLIEFVKQVNMQIGTTTGSVGRNNPNNYETGEPSNPFRNNPTRKKKHTDNFQNKKRPPIRMSTINEEFKLQNPLLL